MLILKFTWKGKGSTIVTIVFKEKNEQSVLTLPGFKIYYKLAVIKIWHFYQHKHLNLQTRIVYIKFYIYNQLIFGETGEFNEKKMAF